MVALLYLVLRQGLMCDFPVGGDSHFGPRVDVSKVMIRFFFV